MVATSILRQVKETAARICLVEDDDAVRRLLGAALTRSGLKVCHAGSRADAAKLCGEARARQGEFDAIICDLELPDGSGAEFLAEQRAAGWRGAAVIYSGNEAPLGLAGMKEAGVQLHLRKGHELSDVVARIVELLEGREGGAGGRPTDDLPASLLTQYRRSLSRDGEVLAALCADRHKEEIRALSHRLRGSAALFGASRLRMAADSCERVCGEAGSEALEAARAELLRAIEAEMAG